jgi:hypothetical protein
VRYPILQRCLVRPDGSAGGADWQGIAYNVSATGLGLALPGPLRPGDVLLVEPCGLGGTRPLRARIVHSAPSPFLWFHGCQLDGPLGHDELGHWAGAGGLPRAVVLTPPFARPSA